MTGDTGKKERKKERKKEKRKKNRNKERKKERKNKERKEGRSEPPVTIALKILTKNSSRMSHSKVKFKGL